MVAERALYFSFLDPPTQFFANLKLEIKIVIPLCLSLAAQKISLVMIFSFDLAYVIKQFLGIFSSEHNYIKLTFDKINEQYYEIV